MSFATDPRPKTGKSIVDMVRNMQKYVMPPSMDFVKYPEIDPFAMYIFEFKHNLTKEDITNIWQNLPPQIGRSFEEAEVTIGHQLLKQELLGGGAEIVDGEVRKNVQTNLDSKYSVVTCKISYNKQHSNISQDISPDDQFNIPNQSSNKNDDENR